MMRLVGAGQEGGKRWTSRCVARVCLLCWPGNVGTFVLGHGDVHARCRALGANSKFCCGLAGLHRRVQGPSVVANLSAGIQEHIRLSPTASWRKAVGESYRGAFRISYNFHRCMEGNQSRVLVWGTCGSPVVVRSSCTGNASTGRWGQKGDVSRGMGCACRLFCESVTHSQWPVSTSTQRGNNIIT